ncbi:MBL fold metallo-hydrolase [Streptomyces sp. SID8352]|uniref:MBL fold metallo-hydrolase n=1 Tax=Streptomyces sp. SID8352 TaxID=2690338 RepID=UPI0013703564|nr:MBL fold metallo-hydrolase [Streptomyces sp. SID8352]MYU26332.1 MBL fold metallo-hydrolase [Streptomyces sp. SID8352]
MNGSQFTPCCAGSAQPPSRRGLLKAAGAVGGAGLMALGGSGAAVAAPGSAGNGAHRGEWAGLRVVLLGTGGGPVPMTDRQMTSQAVVVDGRAYVVDCGSGVVRQLYAAGITHAMVRALFVTHFHADHFSDYLPMILFGRPIPGVGYGYPDRLHVYGPPSLGLPPGTPAPGVELIRPENPHPGMTDVHHGILEGFATTTNSQGIASRMGPDIRDLVVPHDIPVTAPASLPAPPRTRPFTVYEDDRVRVSATLVTHYWPFPAFGFRFDTDHGSVTFSGDTTPSANLVELARGTDLLVHEVMDGQRMIDTGTAEDMVRGLRGCHTDITEVGGVAADAGARRLALSHIVPLGLTSPTPPKIPVGRWRSRVGRDYGGDLVLGEDLMRLRVRGRRTR